MNYYIEECKYPGVYLRHYKNHRVADFTCKCLNDAAEFNKYKVVAKDDIVHVMRVNRNPDVDPYAWR